MIITGDAARLRDFVVRVRVRMKEAQAHLRAGHAPEAVSAVQEAFEFLVKGLCVVAGVEYPRTHGIDPGRNTASVRKLLHDVPPRLYDAVRKYASLDEFRAGESPMHLAELGTALGPAWEIVEEIAQASRSTIVPALFGRIPDECLQRALFHANLWAQFYKAAKYGDEVLGAPPSLLVTEREAALAVEHLSAAEPVLHQLALKMLDIVLDTVVRRFHEPPEGAMVPPGAGQE